MDFANRVNAALQDGLDIIENEARRGGAEVRKLHEEITPVFKRVMALPDDENKLRGLRSLGNASVSGLAHIANDARKAIFADIIGASVKHATNILGSLLGKIG
jgi:hypothetical protein